MPVWLVCCIALSTISWWYIGYLIRPFYRIDALIRPLPAAVQWLLSAACCYGLVSYLYHSDTGYLHIGLLLMGVAVVNMLVYAGMYIMVTHAETPGPESPAEARAGAFWAVACSAFVVISMLFPYVAGARSEGEFMRELLTRVESHPDGDHIHVVCSRVDQCHSHGVTSLEIEALYREGVYFQFTTEDAAFRQQIINCATNDDELGRLRGRVITLVLPPGTDLRPSPETGRVIPLRDVRWRS